MRTLRAIADLCARHPWRAWGCYFIGSALLYGLALYFPWRTPTVIAPGAVDEALSFAPHAFAPYLTYFFLLPTLIFLRRSDPKLGVLLVATFSATLATLLINLAWPTCIDLTIPEPPGFLGEMIFGTDGPGNALPSGHVSHPAAIFAACLVLRDRLWLLYAPWTLLLALCALVTHQHHFADVVAGFALGFPIGALVAALLTSRAAPLTSGARRPRVRWRTVAAIVGEFAICAIVLAWAAARWDAIAIVVALIILGTRQHALFILYHDAVHYNVARNRRLNDLIINLFVGVPQLLPVHVYRSLHLSHHRNLGTTRDPERALLFAGQPWQYSPVSPGTLLRQLAGDLFLVNGIRTLIAFANERRDPRRLGLAPRLAYPELWLMIAGYLALIAIGFLIAPTFTAHALVLWLVAQLTMLQLLQKIRSLAEHAGADIATSHNWRTGWLGRLTIWPYHINFHRQHHDEPATPWYELPRRFEAAASKATPSLTAVLLHAPHSSS